MYSSLDTLQKIFKKKETGFRGKGRSVSSFEDLEKISNSPFTKNIKENLAKRTSAIQKLKYMQSTGMEYINPRLAEDAISSYLPSRYFHGTKYVFNKFDLSKMRSENVATDIGAVFFSESSDFANEYTESFFNLDTGFSGGDNPNVRPVKIANDRIWDYKNPEHRELIRESIFKKNADKWTGTLEEKNAMLDLRLSSGGWRIIEPELGIIKDAGFKAAKIREKGASSIGENIAVFDPRIIEPEFKNPSAFRFTRSSSQEAMYLTAKNTGIRFGKKGYGAIKGALSLIK